MEVRTENINLENAKQTYLKQLKQINDYRESERIKNNTNDKFIEYRELFKVGCKVFGSY